jgi:putative transcriptional regulator
MKSEIPGDRTEIQPGTLLLSEPFMQDPLFGRSVVLICHHDSEGTIGLILNKLTDSPFEEDHPLGRFPFFVGGPVDPQNMFFLHPLSYLKDCVLIREGIYWQGAYEALLEAVEEGAFSARKGKLLIGYSGWEKGQLQEELEREEWLVYNGPIDFILEIDPLEMWKRILQKMGPYYKMVSNFPTDPNLN